jgi:predicted transport protein
LLNVERVDRELSTREVKAKPFAVGGGKGPGGVGYDLQHHVAKMSDRTQALFHTLRDQIIALGDDVTERFMNQYVGYRRLRNFTEVVGQKRKLNVFIDGPVNAEGIGEDVSNIGHWGRALGALASRTMAT